MNLDALERAAVAGTMKWRDAHALVSLARQLLRLRTVARDFYNSTVANPELRLSASNKKVRDEALRAGERLRESLEATAPGIPTSKCATCNDHGMVGGPSYYSPDEGGVPCPVCAALTPLQTAATRDVLAERQRQISAEGWTPEHDDEHIPGTLSQAAGCYVEWNAWEAEYQRDGAIPVNWPWAAEWWKPKDERRNLVRAGALILAEIERLDRAANKSVIAANSAVNSREAGQ